MTSLMSADDLDALNAPIEGEVVEPRRRERNEGRSAEILPPDVESKVTALRTLGGESQARSVTVMLNHARTGLLTAIAAQDLPGIVEYKQKAHAITEISKQLRVGKELQLDAAEFLRRAERGLGVAIREGQNNGTVETPEDARSRIGRNAVAARESKIGRSSTSEADDRNAKTRVTSLASTNELNGQYQEGRRGGGIYDLTDGVSNEQFDDAINEAKTEGNLSRANVARKAKAKAKPTIPDDDPLIDADVASKPTVDDVISPDQVDEIKKPKLPRQGGPKGDPNEMLGNIDGMLRGIVGTLEFIQPQDISDEERHKLTTGIFQSLSAIRKHVKGIANA